MLDSSYISLVILEYIIKIIIQKFVNIIVDYLKKKTIIIYIKLINKIKFFVIF